MGWRGKERRYKLPISSNIRNQGRHISIDPIEIKKISEYYPHLYAHKSDNLNEMDVVLKR